MGRGLAIAGLSALRPHALPRRWRATTGLLLVLAGLTGLTGLAWAALAPIETDTRDELFEIPRGTWSRRMAGNPVEILPDTIRLTLGLNDVLLLRNLDDVPQVFGPVLIMPGQSFRLPFEVASTYSFACTAHASGQMSVIVEPGPARGWPALRWRIDRLKRLAPRWLGAPG
jgi:hypothetical protein